ncbi:MAG TPA: AmmeMemoRadiSam system protein B, partial [Bacteroidales bacterium]|nr:AmmeMemoRadiSam system protein B [Bacteroidales bacterium]
FNQLEQNKEYKTIFIIGTSHRTTFDGAAIYNSGDFITPLGKIKVDKELASKLLKENKCFVVKDDAHIYEHCLEVQMPFLQYYLKKPFKIVPIIIATYSINTIRQIANALEPFFNKDNLFVISTDFSHYPSYNDAYVVDKKTAQAIISNNSETLLNEIEEDIKDIPNLSTKLCGWSSVLTLLYITENNADYQYIPIQYMNSGDVSGDKSRVVGYWAISVVQNNNKTDFINNNKEFELKTQDKKILLNIARETLESYIQKKIIPKIDTTSFSSIMYKKCGAFVTLHINGKLRGCIGRFFSDIPLYKLIQEMTIASATQDSRFMPVSKDEINKIDIEISILTPLKKINSIDEFELGKHGIYMNLNGRTGTFLPQVAIETGWDKEEFLGHCARDKAGIGWDGWKKAELYTYEAIVFSEKDFEK